MTKSDGRDTSGRFAPGNTCGRGRPLAAKAAQFRGALMEAVSAADIAAIAKTLVSKAKRGDMAAIRILFDRLIGMPLPADILERIETLEKGINHVN